VIAARPGIGAMTTVTPKASSASCVPVAGLQTPVASDAPNAGLGGMVAPGRGGVVSAVENAVALLASSEKPGAGGQVVIEPIAPPAIVAAVPVMGGNAPSAVGIVPGALRPGTGMMPSAPVADGTAIPDPAMP
jgi:hypothetical protein